MAYILSEPRANDVLDRLNRIFADVQTRSNTLLAKATSNINDAIAFAEYIDRQDQAISAAIASIDNQALINVARAEYNDPAYDPVAEFTAARTAMNNLALSSTPISRASPVALLARLPGRLMWAECLFS